jgi:chaperonin cofactor prefoldin
VAIDGSRFKAVNAKAKNYTRGKLRQKLGEIDKAIQRYLSELDRADEVFEQTGTMLPEARMERALRKLEHLQKDAIRYRSIEKRMDETGETQVSLSDPDARSMATTPRMPRVVGYNVQTAVEAETHLIVADEVTMQGYDRDALSMMAVAARDAMASDQIEAMAPSRACYAYTAGQWTRGTTRARQSWPAKRQVSRSLFPNLRPRMLVRGGSSIKLILRMTRRLTSVSVPLANT